MLVRILHEILPPPPPFRPWIVSQVWSPQLATVWTSSTRARHRFFLLQGLLQCVLF